MILMTGRRAVLVMALAAGAACGTDEAPVRDSAALAASGGIIADSGAVPMLVADYRLSEERVDGWRGAHRAMSELPVDNDFQPVRLADAMDDDVERTVRFISGRPDMRATIERSGLSVRDYVLTTLALARADLVSRRPADSARIMMATENRAFASRYGDEQRRTQTGRRFRVVDDSDSDSNARKGRGGGKGKGKGKSKDRDKH